MKASTVFSSLSPGIWRRAEAWLLSGIIVLMIIRKMDWEISADSSYGCMGNDRVTVQAASMGPVEQPTVIFVSADLRAIRCTHSSAGPGEQQ